MDERESVVDLLSRLEEGLLPLATNLNAKKVQLGKLEAEVDWGSGGFCELKYGLQVQERQQVLKGVEQKIETSQKILRYDLVNYCTLAIIPFHSAS